VSNTEDNLLPRLPDGMEQRGGDPQLEADELLSIVRSHIRAHPRSGQRMPGPSELGTPCTRRLGYKLLGVEPVNPRGDAWKPTVGTAVHAWLEQALQAFNDSHNCDRFYLEERVTVGQLHGKDVRGTCDVYDRITATVVDWKVVGLAALKRYRKEQHPGTAYRAQCHLYGRGFVAAGLPVDHVGVLFLPQNDELSSAYYWTEPYDEQVALDALAKANGVADLVDKVQHLALPLLPTADAFCTYCPNFLPGATEVAEACPGHPTNSTGSLPVALPTPPGQTTAA